MEILPIYSKRQMETCKNAGLDPSMIYLLDASKGKRFSDEEWNSINTDYLGWLRGIVPFLQAVEETKLLIEPEIYKKGEEIKQGIAGYANSDIISKVVSRAIESPSWRERATIMNLITKMYGELDSRYIQTATAIELIQEAFMLQDDVLDEQERCVNRETIPSLYGIARANLAKDLIISKAGDVLREGLDQKIMREGMALAEEMLKNDTLGQWIDMESEKRVSMNEEEYYEMIKLTPGTQFKNITHLSYLLTGGNNKEIIENLRQFGLYFGMAAQLRDDIIDIIGDEEVVYKKLGTDVLRRKKRLPLIKYLEENPEDMKLFSGEIREEDAERIIKRIKNSKALPYSIDKTREFIDRGLDALYRLKDSPEKEVLEATASLVKNFDEY